MDTTTTYQSIDHFLTFASHIIIFIVGIVVLIITIYGLSKGGLRLLRVSKKISKFVDRVDCLIDDFWPEILSGLEKKGFINIGSSARWTSIQAKILKSQSPIQITEEGNKIIEEISFGKTYSDHLPLFQMLLKDKLIGIVNITEFDIEQASLKVIAELFDKSDPLIKNAETYSFNNPKMPLSQLKALLGIFIRDKIIKDPNMRQIFGLTPNEIKPSSES